MAKVRTKTTTIIFSLKQRMKPYFPYNFDLNHLVWVDRWGSDAVMNIPTLKSPRSGEELLMWPLNCAFCWFSKELWKFNSNNILQWTHLKKRLFKPTPSKDKCIQGLLATPYWGFADLHQHLDIIPKHGKTMKNENLNQKICFWRKRRRKLSGSHLHKHL